MKNNQVIFCTIKGSTIKKFLIVECLTGTGFYYAAKIISSSVLIGMISSMVGTETIKKLLKCLEKSRIKLVSKHPLHFYTKKEHEQP